MANNALSVSELNREVKNLLENSLMRVLVTGEVSNFSCPASGHWYFTLKDERAQVRCAMFKGRNFRVGQRPANGDDVTVMAKVTLYEGRGEYQLVVDSLETAGEGALRRAYEALRLRLQAEGLFDVAHKRPIPRLPRRIGIITSATGAAIRDILSVLARRFPAIPVYLLPVPVQGDEAAPAIVHALARANEHDLADVLIVGRGGGSLEDLWAFNEEPVVRAIHASRIPVISAVGHETDTTLADFAADYRAPTPSAAAEQASPDQVEWMQRLDRIELILQQHMQRTFQQYTRQLTQLRERLEAGALSGSQEKQRLESLNERLRRAGLRLVTDKRRQLQQLSPRLRDPRQQLQQQGERAETLRQRLEQIILRLLNQREQSLTAGMRQLHAVSPLGTLSRGYAIVTDAAGHVVESAEQVEVGAEVSNRLKQGTLTCQVIGVSSD